MRFKLLWEQHLLYLSMLEWCYVIITWWDTHMWQKFCFKSYKSWCLFVKPCWRHAFVWVDALHLALKWKGCYSKNVRKSRDWVGRGARERARGWNVSKKTNKKQTQQKTKNKQSEKKPKQKEIPTPSPPPPLKVYFCYKNVKFYIYIYIFRSWNVVVTYWVGSNFCMLWTCSSLFCGLFFTL